MFLRSIYAAAGEPFTETKLRIVRPGNGATPPLYRQLLGRTALCANSRGDPPR